MSDIVLVYITAPTESEAMKIGRALVEQKLAACVNIFSSIKSICEWEGKINQGTEVALIAKTKASLFEALAAKVKDLNSYETPCIVALPVLAGDHDFLTWVNQNTLA